MFSHRIDTVMCLDVWDQLQWRHHNGGLLQAYFPRSSNHRVHIWHRSLNQYGWEALHNHRFRLTSHVLAGSLTHERLALQTDPHGKYGLWEIPGASQGSTETLREVDRVSIARFDRQRFRAGDQYRVEKWEYHHARQELEDAELTVTLVRLYDKEHAGAASLLAPAGHRPTHAFTETPDSVHVQRLVREAKKLLVQQCVEDHATHSP